MCKVNKIFNLLFLSKMFEIKIIIISEALSSDRCMQI